MAKIKRNVKEPPPVYKLGDVVSFPFGGAWVTGKVVEDRGCLGIGGRRLYGIKFEINPGEEAYIELGEAEVTPGVSPVPQTAANDQRQPKNGVVLPSENAPAATPPRIIFQLLDLSRKLPAIERVALLGRLGAKLSAGQQFELLARVLVQLSPEELRALEEELTGQLGARSN